MSEPAEPSIQALGVRGGGSPNLGPGCGGRRRCPGRKERVSAAPKPQLASRQRSPGFPRYLPGVCNSLALGWQETVESQLGRSPGVV